MSRESRREIFNFSVNPAGTGLAVERADQWTRVSKIKICDCVFDVVGYKRKGQRRSCGIIVEDAAQDYIML